MENFSCMYFNSLNIFICLKQGELFLSHRFWVQFQFIKLRMVAIIFWGMGSKKTVDKKCGYCIDAVI